jgi:ketosteroid isomerase-like protein
MAISLRYDKPQKREVDAMSTIEIENRERVAEVFEAFGRGDVAFILEQLADDVRFVSHLEPVVPWAGEYVGREEVARYFEALGSAVEVADHPVHQLIVEGDTVVATGDVSFRVRETGTTASSSWVYVWKLEDGAIQSFDQYNDNGLADAFR